MDSLTSKFGRTSDILVKKFIRSVLQHVDEYPETIIDDLNAAEKLGMVTSAQTFQKLGYCATRLLMNIGLKI